MNSTIPISTNAMRSRSSMDSSFLGVPGAVGVFGKSAMFSDVFNARDRTRRRGTDDNAAGGGFPWRRRVERHSVPRPPTYIPSRLGESGRRMEAWERSSVYKNAKSRQLVRAFQDQPIHFAAQFVRRSQQDLPPRVEHNIPVRCDFGEP